MMRHDTPECEKRDSAHPVQRGRGVVIGLLVASITAILLSPGCGNSQPRAAGIPLEERVKEYWTLKLQGDELRRYEYLEPSYRAVVSAEEFIRKSAGAAVYTGFEIKEVSIDGSDAVVDLEYTWHIHPSLLKGIKPPIKTVPQESQWVLVDGVWYKKASPTADESNRPGDGRTSATDSATRE